MPCDPLVFSSNAVSLVAREPAILSSGSASTLNSLMDHESQEIPSREVERTPGSESSANVTHQVIQQLSLGVELVDEPRKAEGSLPAEVAGGLDFELSALFRKPIRGHAMETPVEAVHLQSRRVGYSEITYLAALSSV